MLLKRYIVLFIVAALCGAASITHFLTIQVGRGQEDGQVGFTRSLSLKPPPPLLHSNLEVLSFVASANKYVHQSTYHCDYSSYRLSAIDQMVALALDTSQDFASEGMLVSSRLECGFCHQRAIELAKLLLSNDIESRVHGLSGHVVVKARIGNNDYYVDPDFGVGPLEAETLNKSILINAYGGTGKENEISNIYLSKSNNRDYPPQIWGIVERQERTIAISNAIAVFLFFVSLASVILLIVHFNVNIKILRPGLVVQHPKG